jgi:hypothetical protein
LQFLYPNLSTKLYNIVLHLQLFPSKGYLNFHANEKFQKTEKMINFFIDIFIQNKNKACRMTSQEAWNVFFRHKTEDGTHTFSRYEVHKFGSRNIKQLWSRCLQLEKKGRALIATNFQTVDEISYVIMDDPEEELYVVKKILNEKVEDGELYYKVWWKDWGIETATWEPAENLQGNIQLIAYERQKENENERIEKVRDEDILEAAAENAQMDVEAEIELLSETEEPQRKRKKIRKKSKTSPAQKRKIQTASDSGNPEKKLKEKVFA